jgi:hypothetical protein
MSHPNHHSRGALAGLALTALALAACGKDIWNAGDLAEWVHDRAVEGGCARESITLDEWTTETPDGNEWRGTCEDAASGERRAFAIDVDPVWKPSGG